MLPFRCAVVALCATAAFNVNEPSLASPASVELIPARATVSIASSEPFSAIVRTAAVEVVANAPVTFNSTGAVIATSVTR